MSRGALFAACLLAQGALAGATAENHTHRDDCAAPVPGEYAFELVTKGREWAASTNLASPLTAGAFEAAPTPSACVPG